MINLCQECLRLNPYGRRQCYYCQGECQLMPPADYGQFLIKSLVQNQKRKNKEDEEIEAYPDLAVFEESRQVSDWQEIIVARP